jgi:hypothetical protein
MEMRAIKEVVVLVKATTFLKETRSQAVASGWLE